MLAGMARNAMPPRLRHEVSRYLQRRRLIDGTPDAITFAELDELCGAEFNERLGDVAYLGLSAWKKSGAFLLVMHTVSGRRWSLVYKNAVYDLDEIPALAGFPALPGPPEHVVFLHRRGELAEYLPRVYRARECSPGPRFEYVLEDMGRDYRKLYRESDVAAAAEVLPALHRAMDAAIPADDNRLIRYDHKFAAALLVYARTNFEAYLQRVGSAAISKAVELWPGISSLYLDDEFRQQAPCIIHGDYNASNILRHVRAAERITVLDWEWAGLGLAHADLAALLKQTSPEFEKRTLERFAEQVRTLPLDTHRRLYEWCQLERGLIDAAYLTAQLLGTSDEVDWFRGYIEQSMLRGLRAYLALTSQSE